MKTQTQGKGRVKMKAEAGVVRPLAKGAKDCLQTIGSQEGVRRTPTLGVRGSLPPPAWFQTSSLQNCETIHLSLSRLLPGPLFGQLGNSGSLGAKSGPYEPALHPAPSSLLAEGALL